MAEKEKQKIEFHHVKSISLDARRKRKRRSSFEVNKAAEVEFEKALRKVARYSGQIVKRHVSGSTLKSTGAMNAALNAYAKTITPWATRQAFKMVQSSNAKNKKAWMGTAVKMNKALAIEMAEAPTGRVAERLVREQVGLIKSIPLEAGERAQSLALKAIQDGSRADEIAEELLKTEEVTESRAMLIARTETARSNSSLNQARAQSVGANTYIWRTAGDGDVRESHAEMEGKVCEYDNPPTLSDGTTINPGEIYNCRCYAEPVLPELEA